MIATPKSPNTAANITANKPGTPSILKSMAAISTRSNIPIRTACRHGGKGPGIFLVPPPAEIHSAKMKDFAFSDRLLESECLPRDS
jgi:hypothetical protein